MNGAHPSVQDLFRLDGKVAIVTGATGYLGSAMAHALAEAGASVVASSRNATHARAVADKLPAEAGQTHAAVCIDQMDPESIGRGFADALEAVGNVDILVNNGHEATAADWTDVTHAEFTRQLANASGYFQLARQLHDHVTARHGEASIIMLGSMYGLVGSYPDAYRDICPASPVAYHTLKGGIVQMTRHLAVYWAADSVRVNCLCPGPFPDPERAPAELMERLLVHVPMGRLGQPIDVAGAIVFLASGASRYMTGQTLVIDGGWTAW